MEMPLWCIILIAGLVILLSSIIGYLLGKNGPKSTSKESCQQNSCIHIAKRNFWHMVVGFGIILCFIMVDLFVGNKDALNYFSFASTIASIILSVIAIIMTITSEQKSDNVKAAIDNSVRYLETSTEKISKYAENLELQSKTFQQTLQKSEETLKRTEDIRARIEELWEKTEELEKSVQDIKTMSTSKKDVAPKAYEDTSLSIIESEPAKDSGPDKSNPQ